MTYTQETMKTGLRLTLFRKALLTLAAILAVQVAIAGFGLAQALADASGFTRPMVLAANDTTSPSASTTSPSGQMVIVKPMKPTTTPAVDPVSLTEDTRQVMTTFADELATHAKELETLQGDVALCYDAAKGKDGQAPHGVDYYECVAKAVAETKAGWTAMAGSFHDFADSLDKITTQVGSLQQYVGTRSQAITDEYPADPDLDRQRTAEAVAGQGRPGARADPDARPSATDPLADRRCVVDVSARQAARR